MTTEDSGVREIRCPEAYWWTELEGHPWHWALYSDKVALREADLEPHENCGFGDIWDLIRPLPAENFGHWTENTVKLVNIVFREKESKAELFF